VSEDDLALLAQTVEDAVRAVGNPELPAHEVGMAILGPLRKLDEVAYLRFASVYRSFESLEDFEAEVALLRIERESHADVVSSAEVEISITSTPHNNPDHASQARSASRQPNN